MDPIKLADVAYVAYEVPDLGLIQRFLTDFGMKETARSDEALYMRGTGPSHHIYVARKGAEARFLGGAFTVADAAEFERAAGIPGASPTTNIGEPGGGRRISLTTPNGYDIWLEHGVEALPELPVRPSFQLNSADTHNRKNVPVRQPTESVPVLRIGHFVLWVEDVAAEVAWFTEHFAMTPSDHICMPGDPDPIVLGTFLRHDRGAEFVEHHLLLITKSEKRGCHHSSFEVADLDAVQAGHDHLVAQGWSLDAGVGRHMLGSLIYDYWLDPFGQRIEHYTDTDMLNDAWKPVFFVGTADETTQWGMAPPPDFFE